MPGQVRRKQTARKGLEYRARLSILRVRVVIEGVLGR